MVGSLVQLDVDIPVCSADLGGQALVRSMLCVFGAPCKVCQSVVVLRDRRTDIARDKLAMLCHRLTPIFDL